MSTDVAQYEYVKKDKTEILEEMLDSISSELGGVSISHQSDIAIKYKVFAAMLEGLYLNQEWIKRQMMPQTATGKWLEYHTMQRDVKREEAKYATGTVTFSRSAAFDNDLYIKAGTKLSTWPNRDGAKIMFETVTEGVLKEGATEVSVGIQAIIPGVIGNVVENEITIMIEPPIGIEFVTNKQKLENGDDGDSDDELRARYFKICEKRSNGVNAAYYEDLALKNGAAQVLVDSLNEEVGVVRVYAVPEQIPEDEDAQKAFAARLEAVLNEHRAACCNVMVAFPEIKYVNVKINISINEGETTFDNVKATLSDNIKKYINGSGIGGAILLSEIGNVIYNTEGVNDYEICKPTENKRADKTELLMVGTICVRAMEIGE